MKNLIIGTLCLASLVGCEEIDRIKGQVDNVEKRMNNMDTNTSYMYLQVRQKEAEDTRTKQMAILRDSSTDMGSKLTAAKKYCIAFEYNFWTGNGMDNLLYREFMLDEALEEFYREMVDIHADFRATSPIELNKANTLTKAFYAIASTAHFENIQQEIIVKKKKRVKLTSLYDVMKSALEKYETGKIDSLTHAEEVVVRGQNLQITKDLINARMNFMLALGIKDFVASDDMNTLEKGSGLLYKLTRGRLGALHLDSELESQNLITQSDIFKKIDGARKAKDILDKYGYEVRVDRSLRSILSHLYIEGEDFQTSSSNDQAKVQEIYELLGKFI